MALFGAAGNTGNLGVSALSLSTLRAVLDRRPGARRLVFDHDRGRRTVADSSVGTYECDGAWNSRRLHRDESLWTMRLNSLVGVPPNRNVDAIRSSAVVLDITGGDSFTDLYGPRRWHSSILPKQITLRVGTPLVLLPQTYGPFTHPGRQQAAARVVAAAESAWARDPDGLDQLQQILGSDFDPARHRQGVDVAFALPAVPPSDLPDPLGPWLSSGSPRPTTVGLNVSGLLANDPDTARQEFGLALDYKRAVRRLAERLLDEVCDRLVLVPHVRGASDESDDAACRDLARTLDLPERVVTLPAGLDASQTKWCISRLDWFCGTRMHSTIAALSSGVPAAAVAYSHKTRGVFETCGLRHAVVDARSVGTPDAVDQLVELATRRDGDRAVLADTVDGVIDRASRQFDEILASVPAS